MEFIKKHYEKILLGAVLLGLTVAVALLPFLIASKREQLKAASEIRTTFKVKELTNLDMTVYEGALKRMESPPNLNYSLPHNLYNPVPWQKAADGRLIKLQTGNEVGPKAVEVTAIKPLYLFLTLDSIGPAGYLIGVKKEAAMDPNKRTKKQTYSSLPNSAKNDTFSLLEIKGPAENPTELVLELNDTNEKLSISTNQSFKRVDGYMADLKYEPEKKNWSDRRVGSPPLSFGGEDYKIVAITRTNVVLSAKSNEKNWTINFSAPN